MYKDKDKQREATKERVRRYREKQKGVTKTKGVTSSPTSEGVTSGEGVTPDYVRAPVRFPKYNYSADWKDS